VTGADAIHPATGFLSENAHFVDVCESCGFTFIGPTAEMIRRMGDKAEAKRTMKAAGLPLVPGSEGVLRDVDESALDRARDRLPVIIKASAGGGGRGMRIAWDERQLKASFASPRRSRGRVQQRRRVPREIHRQARHIEFQLFGDGHGDVVHLGERECSVQRNHQKLIEEAPSSVLTPEQRVPDGELAARGAASIGYRNAGTMSSCSTRMARSTSWR